ncbi:endonuclease [Streptomyces sp. M-16]
MTDLSSSTAAWPPEISRSTVQGRAQRSQGGQRAVGQWLTNVRRMLLYMAVRYDGGDGFPDLEMNDKVNNGTAPLFGRISLLKQWNQMDLPDAFEQRRNQVIFDTYQHNRNPFIDHPEWVDSIW